MISHYLSFLCSSSYYDGDNLQCKRSRMIVHNEAAISMANCHKDSADNRYVAERYHYAKEGITLIEYIFEWIGTKHQLADIYHKLVTIIVNYST